MVTPILARLARRAGVKIHLEPRYKYAGQIELPGGRKSYFRGTFFDINPLGAARVASDKAYAAYFLKRMGYHVPRGEAFFTPRWCREMGEDRGPEKAYCYAARLGFPVIVKPNNLSQGAGVFLVKNKKELLRAVSIISKKDKIFLVQERILGRDYRIVVLDNKIISAYERIPLAVTGDGTSTIRRLLLKKQKEFIRRRRDTVLALDDPRMKNRLGHLRLSLSTVLSKGAAARLLDNANLSSGGEAVDVTRRIHPTFKKLAARATADMGLRFAGVDIMADGDITKPARQGRWTILEINDGPGLDHYATFGPAQKKLVENMYLQVLRAMKKL